MKIVVRLKPFLIYLFSYTFLSILWEIIISLSQHRDITVQGSVLIFLGTFFANILHEAGHYTVARVLGCRVSYIKIAFDWTIYTDVIRGKWKLISYCLVGLAIEVAVGLCLGVFYVITKNLYVILLAVYYVLSGLTNLYPFKKGTDVYNLLARRRRNWLQ